MCGLPPSVIPFRGHRCRSFLRMGADDQFVYTVAGKTSDSTEPACTALVGVPFTDGEVTWSNLGNCNPMLIVMPQNVRSGSGVFLDGTELRDFGVLSSTSAPVASAVFTHAGYMEIFSRLDIEKINGDAIQAPSMIGDPDGSNVTVLERCRLFGNKRWGFLGYCPNGSNKSLLVRRDNFLAFNVQGGIMWQGQTMTGGHNAYAENGIGQVIPFAHGL